MPQQAGVHYNRAPIREAIFNISIEGISEDRIDHLASFWQTVESEFPIPVQRRTHGEQSNSPDTTIARKSSDSSRVVEARTDGLAFSRLAPYDSWESFTTETRRIWDIYVAIIGPVQLTGFFVRYINVIRIPLGRPLHNFFTVYPAMPDRETLFSGLFMLTKTQISSPPGSFTVIFTPDGPADEGHFHMLLDNTFEFEVEQEDSMWKSLPKIRELKNSTFTDQLTAELRETIS